MRYGGPESRILQDRVTFNAWLDLMRRRLEWAREGYPDPEAPRNTSTVEETPLSRRIDR